MSFQEFRTGQGWDTHRIVGGRPLMIGGIAIEWDYGLDGHSDADILLHAVTDAMLGAIADGDIGVHFPNSDERWRKKPSRVFLEDAVRRVREKGFTLINIDSTVILEAPKLKNYRDGIRQSISEIVGLPLDRISVKFKMAEGVGPVGRGSSAEAQAIVTIGR